MKTLRTFPLFPAMARTVRNIRARYGLGDAKEFTPTELEIAARFNAGEELRLLREAKARKGNV